jgi:DNA-binding transcriptional LysR family regulator
MLHHELDKFLYIIDLGGFNTAAKQKHISQPALSSAIKSLEKSFGTQLIARNNRPIKLTRAGELLYEMASKHKSDHIVLKRLIERMGQINSSTKIGAIDSIGHRILNSIKLPDPAEIYVDNSSKLIKMILNDLIDVCFITKPTDKLDSSLNYEHVMDERFATIANHSLVSNDSPLIKGGEINLATYNPESNTYKLILSHLEDLRLNYRVKFTSTSPSLILEYVKRNAAIALLPENTLNYELERNSITQVNLPHFYRPIEIVTRRDFKLTAIHREIIEHLTSGNNSDVGNTNRQPYATN